MSIFSSPRKKILKEIQSTRQDMLGTQLFHDIKQQLEEGKTTLELSNHAFKQLDDQTITEEFAKKQYILNTHIFLSFERNMHLLKQECEQIHNKKINYTYVQHVLKHLEHCRKIRKEIQDIFTKEQRALTEGTALLSQLTRLGNIKYTFGSNDIISCSQLREFYEKYEQNNKHLLHKAKQAFDDWSQLWTQEKPLLKELQTKITYLENNIQIAKTLATEVHAVEQALHHNNQSELGKALIQLLEKEETKKYKPVGKITQYVYTNIPPNGIKSFDVPREFTDSPINIHVEITPKHYALRLKYLLKKGFRPSKRNLRHAIGGLHQLPNIFAYTQEFTDETDVAHIAWIPEEFAFGYEGVRGRPEVVIFSQKHHVHSPTMKLRIRSPKQATSPTQREYIEKLEKDLQDLQVPFEYF